MATAVAAEVNAAHLLPEVVVIVAVFLALRREAPTLVAGREQRLTYACGK